MLCCLFVSPRRNGIAISHVHCGRIGHEVHADAGALALSSADASEEEAADERVGAVVDAERHEKLVHSGVALLDGDFLPHAQRGGEGQRLARRGGRQERVVLHHIGELGAVLDGVDALSVQLDLAGDPRSAGRRDAASQHIQQAGLSGAGGPHESGDLAKLGSEYAR
eukprot:scaffold1266_cov134-Pinguiococcus_pyrenoidosus.AAC.2